MSAAIELAKLKAKRDASEDFIEWAEANFLIEETGEPIVFAPHQKAVLRFVLQRDDNGIFLFKTIIYSAPKKEGKTTLSGAITQWAAETWGRFNEIYCIGNDAEQSRERGFKKMKQSIMLTPGFRFSPQSEDNGTLPGRWIIRTKDAVCTKTGTTVKATATDYKGEAGANPVLSVWTELWGIIHKDATRFWAEMAPSPTRPNSIRWVETYAGYEGESELLWTLYDSTVLSARQITAGELGDLEAFEEAPNIDDLVPLWVDETAGIVAFWDSGPQAHRQPWQKGPHGDAYYANEAKSQTPSQYTRLHLNQWASAESSFIQMEWWDALVNPLPLAIPGTPGARQPMVISLDGAVSGDCFGLVAISRDPDQHLVSCGRGRAGGCWGCANYTVVRASRKWIPPKGGAIQYRPNGACICEPGARKPECPALDHKDGTTPWEVLEWFVKNYNIVQVAYDPYQLHDFATDAQKVMKVWCRVFSQGQDRLVADSDLYSSIVEKRTRHDGDLDIREHFTNANGKLQPDEDSKIRIVKKSATRRIDLVVCVSMANSECLRLNIS